MVCTKIRVQSANFELVSVPKLDFEQAIKGLFGERRRRRTKKTAAQKGVPYQCYTFSLIHPRARAENYSVAALLALLGLGKPTLRRRQIRRGMLGSELSSARVVGVSLVPCCCMTP